MIAQDAKAKDDRYLSLNINVNIDNITGQLEGGKDAVY